ncbi:MAG: type II secretion system F family protein [Lentisphaeraceae bacterium]|nr:type II secretion system F family protein [Lentisphaeraceae bacterium]
MPLFVYEARDSQGEEKSGTIEAENQMIARRLLRKDRLMVLSLEVFEQRAEKRFPLKDLLSVNTKDRVFFCRQLSMMLKSGLTLVNSLTIMSQEFPRKMMRDTLAKVIEDIRGGLPFSEALGKYPKVFTPLLIKVMHCAEQSGEMSAGLLEVSSQLEFRDGMKKKAISACTYPLIVFMLALGVGIFLVFKIIPTFDKFLSKKNIPLPYSTQLVIGISRFAQQYWLHILIVLLAFLIALILMFKNEQGRRVQERFILSLPIFGKLFTSSVIASFSTTSSLLLKSGLGVVESLKLNANIIGFKIYNDIFIQASENVITGTSLTESLRHKIIPNTVTNIIAVGEETGALQDVLNELGEFYNEELKRSVNFLVSALEPVLLILVGGVVALVYFALFQAIIRLMGS